MANENFVVRHGLTVCGNAGIDSNLGVSGTLCVKGVTTLCSDLNIGTGRIIVSTDSTNPHIEIKGSGPNIIRFYDGGSTSATNALDLIYRTSPNTLGFEKSSDGTKIWESDYDNLRTTFHENVTISKNLGVQGNTSLDGTLDVCGNTSLGGTLYVSGNTDLDGTLSVSGNTSIGGTLEVTNATDLNSTLDVCGNTSLGGTLYVSGNTDLDGTLTVCGATTLSSTLTVENNTDLNGTLTVSGNTDVNGTLDVCGNSSLGGTLTVTNATDLNGTLDVCGNSSLGGTLTVTNATDLNGSLDVCGNTSIGGSLEVTNATDLNGDLDVCGNTSLGGSLEVNGNTHLNGYLDVCGNTSIYGPLTVITDANLNGTLDVSGNTSIGGNANIAGTLTVSGNTDLNGTLDVSGNTSIGGALEVTNATDLNSTLDVCGNTSLGGTLYVSGNTTLGGTLSVCGNTTIVSGSLIQFQTVCGNVKGYIQATETNDQHLVIATSGGEDIAFKDGGTGGTTNMVVRGDGNVAVTANISAASGSFAGTVSCENVTTSTLTVKNTATISSDTQVKSRLTVGSGHIGSRNPGFSVIGDSNSSPIVAKVNGKNTTFSVLPWSSGITYITSGIYYDDGAWIHSSDNSYNCLFLISGINGARWYTSNDGSGSWNVASNKSLWNNSGQWDGQLSTNVTYNGNTIWHAGNDGSGSGLDADTLDSIDSSQFLRSDATGTSTQRISFQANATNNWDTIATATGSQGSIEVYNTGDGNDAFMSFHAGGDFAIYFGLDADTNDLSVGGWSMGANKYRVWHAGNDGAGSGLDADNLDGLTWNSSGKDLRGTEIYADNWFRNYNSGEGLYNEATAMHWYSDANNRFRLYSTSTSSAILFTTNGNTVRGYVYADTASSIGFLNTGGQWGLRYLSNDGNSPNLYFLEQSNETWTGNPGNDQGKIEYHSNRFYIASGANSTEVVRFRRSDTNVAYIDNSGNIYSTSSNYRCLTTADEGSGNGIDADTVDGLHVHTGTNNEANKIVRTQANGYIMAGWINTISGDATTNTPDRFYGSYDGYIRYYNRGYTQMYLGNTYKYTTSRRQHTTNADYWVGTMGWGTTDFNTVITWGSGFIDTWSSPGNSPDPMGYSHWVGHQALHYTNGSTNGTGAYGYQMVCGGGTNAPIYVRTTWNGMGSWRALAQYGIISGSSGSLYADIYYDSSNTGYYGDFGSTSRMNQINANMYYSPYPGSDSGLGRSSYPYGWGFQESGAWSSPYPDLVLHYHTGVTLAANPSYNGITFKYDYNNDTVIFRVNGGSSYLYKYYWMYTNTSGYYSDTNSWHINPNDLSSYGSMRLRGSRNSWYGMVIDTGNRPHVMFDGSGNGGFYHQDGGRWSFYYNYSNNCVGMVGSTTSSSFGLYVSKGIYANGTVYAGSDIRIKKDIKTIENALDKVLKLRGVTFIKTNYAENDPQNGKTEMGVIAQEMEKVIPEVVNYAEDIDLYSVSYGNLAGLFIEAFKDQTEIINNLRQEVSDLKNRLGE